MSGNQNYCDSCGSPNPPQQYACWRCKRFVFNRRYRIEERSLASGGHGSVFRAWDEALNNKLVAIKVMHADQSTDAARQEAIAIFEREKAWLSELDHPNIPPIYDSGSDETYYYLVMKFIDGKTLEQLLEQEPEHRLSVSQTLKIAIDLCGVLHDLHTYDSRSIVFRDLKPANIMLTPEPEAKLYLIDFGIARQFKPDKVGDTMRLGTRGYAAPEQYSSDNQSTPKSDIYALGATLHHLLSGNEPDGSLRFQPLDLGNPALVADTQLNKLVMQMLSIDPDGRPESMSEVRSELEQITRKLQTQQNAFVEYNELVGIVTDVAWSYGGDLVASAGDNRTIHVWRAVDGVCEVLYNRHESLISSISWSPDDRYIASAGRDHTVQVWEVVGPVDPGGKGRGRQRFTCRGHKNWVRCVAWSPRTPYIASGGHDEQVYIWDSSTGKVFYTFSHTGSVHAVAWSPDGTRLASAGYDATVQVWDIPAKMLLLTYTGHRDPVSTVAWSADGSYLASGSWDRTVHIWKAETKALMRIDSVSVYASHSRSVTRVAWSPELGSTIIASGSRDQTVQVWDALTGDTIFTYTGHREDVNALAWSPDGTRIVSASDDQTVQLWQVL